MAAESEYEFALRLARSVLDNASLDPDGDLSVLARQFLRSQEPGVRHLRAAAPDLLAAAEAVGIAVFEKLGEIDGAASRPKADPAGK
jgi:hypothetical protein